MSIELFQTLTEQDTKELSALLHLNITALWNDVGSFKYIFASENDLTKKYINTLKLILQFDIWYPEQKT